MEIVVIAVVVVVFLALRIRRIYARHVVSRSVVVTAIVLLAAVLTAVAWPTLTDRALFPSAAAGLALGILLGALGTRLAEVRREVGSICHKVHPALGSLVLLLFLTFLWFRVSRALSAPPVATGLGRSVGLARIDWSPGVVMLRIALLSYFLTYGVGLLYRYRKLGLKPSGDSSCEQSVP